MSIEEIINGLQKIYENDCDSWMHGSAKETIPNIRYYSTVIREAIALLRTHPDARPNELTLEELVGMVGQPVWVVELNGYPPHWAMVYWSGKRKMIYLTIDSGAMISAESFIAVGGRVYRRPPKED